MYVVKITMCILKINMYTCKSTEICDETLKVLLNIFFRAHLRAQVFLIVCSIHKRNLLLYNAYRMVYFF